MEKVIVLLLFAIFTLLASVTYLFPALKCLVSGKVELKENLTVSSTDTLKGIMIIGIMFSHIALKASYFSKGLECDAAIKSVMIFMGYLGSIGVAVFFILSGYGNSVSLEKCKDNKHIFCWFLKRTRKVIQTFILCFAVDICIESLVFGQKYSFIEIIKELLTLTMPRTTTWYLKVQMLLYIFTFISTIIHKRSKKAVNLTVLILCIIYIMISNYVLNSEKFWWNTIICYTIGGYIYIYIDKLQKYLTMHTRIMVFAILIVAIIGLMLDIVFYDNTIVQILSYAFMGTSIVVATELTQTDNIILRKTGRISFEIYLVHIALVSMIFSKYSLSLINVGMFIIISIVSACIVVGLNKMINIGFSNV